MSEMMPETTHTSPIIVFGEPPIENAEFVRGVDENPPWTPYKTADDMFPVDKFEAVKLDYGAIGINELDRELDRQLAEIDSDEIDWFSPEVYGGSPKNDPDLIKRRYEIGDTKGKRRKPHHNTQSSKWEGQGHNYSYDGSFGLKQKVQDEADTRAIKAAFADPRGTITDSEEMVEFRELLKAEVRRAEDREFARRALKGMTKSNKRQTPQTKDNRVKNDDIKVGKSKPKHTLFSVANNAGDLRPEPIFEYGRRGWR
jgi:hypothetical protein